MKARTKGEKSRHTISSLQIGQASCAPAAAGAADIEVSPFSNEMREVRSWVSDDENCEADACEPRETLLVDGERTLVLLVLLGCGEDEAAGVKAFA